MVPAIVSRARKAFHFSFLGANRAPTDLNRQWLYLLLACFFMLTLLCCVPLLLAARWIELLVVLLLLPILIAMVLTTRSLLARPWPLRAALFFWLLYPTAAQWAFGGCSSGLLIVSLTLLSPLLAVQAIDSNEERRFWQALHSAMMTIGALVELTLLPQQSVVLVVSFYVVLLTFGWGIALALERIHRQTVETLERAQSLSDQLSESQYDLREADKVKNDFLASMSHEIRTPMHAISGMADMLLLSDQLGATEHMQAENIKLASQNLLGLINDILDISKIEAGKLELYEERYDFATMFHDVVSIISMRARDRGLSFLTQIDPDIPKEMIGDSVRIRQVLLNLLGNAVKFTEKGYVTLRIQRQYHDSQIMLRFEVVDTGVGISPQDMGRLFGVFEQLETTRKHNRQGTGLGLAISRQLVSLMHGQLDVHSEPGQGTTFFFTIPQQIVGDMPIAEVPEARSKRLLICTDQPAFADNAIEMAARLKVKAVQGLPSEAAGFTHMLIDLSAEPAYTWVRQPSTPGCQRALLIDPATALTAYIRMTDRVLFQPLHIISLSALLNDVQTAGGIAASTQRNRECIFQTIDARVLLIDDNEVSLMVASNLLSLFGLQVDRASSGRQGIAMLENSAYDIVFVDHVMPDMDGVEVVRAIRQMGGRFAKQHILMLSANVMPESRKMFLTAGATDMLAKPIELPKLSQLLAEYLPPEKQVAAQSGAAQSGYLQARLTQLEQALRPLSLQRASYLLSTGNIEQIDDYLAEMQSVCAQLTPHVEQLRRGAGHVTQYASLVGTLQAARKLLAHIGETRLSTRAKLLATSLEQGDLGFVRENMRFFVGELTAYHELLSSALHQCSLSGTHKPSEILLLEQLHGQVLAYQYAEANQTMLALHDALVHVTPEQFGALLDALQLFDYRHAHEQVNALLENLTAQADSAAPAAKPAKEVTHA